MESAITRRGFLGSALAVSATGAFAMPPGEAASRLGLGEVRLRFGVLSDIHVTSPKQLPKIERALRRFDDWKADAVLCCGDIADFGLKQQLNLMGGLWKKVFPGGKGADGREVVNLFHYGDHDMAVNYADNHPAPELWPDAAERQAGLIFNGDRGQIWKDAFGAEEPWAPIVLRKVKGYPFVLSHFTRGEEGNRYGNNVPGLDTFMADHARDFDPKKPLFYSQHRIPRDTACGREVYGQDDGTVGGTLSRFPNAIAFCGHCHMNAANERSIWQGGFTCIQVPGHRYCTTESGRENGYAQADKRRTGPAQTMRGVPCHSAGQALFCRVYDTALVVERVEISGKAVNHMGDDWVVPFASFTLPAAERPFAHGRRFREMPVPVFGSGAAVKAEIVKGTDRKGNEDEFVELTFPAAAKCAGHPRANDYDVALEAKENDGVREVLRKRFYPNLYHYGDASDSKEIVGRIRRSDVPKTGQHRFVVRPVNGMGRMGEAIATDWLK